jgi:IS5 family transposase
MLDKMCRNMLVFNNLTSLKELIMPACATQETIVERLPVGNLFLPVPDTDFRDFLDEVEELARFSPGIIEAIKQDLEANARTKKHLRLADRKFGESRTADLPDFHVEEAELLADELEIGTGRPRMSADLVYLFLMIRGFLGGSLASKPSRRFMCESMSLYGYLDNRGVRMPGVTTILENVNLVNAKTLNMILDKQIEFVLKEDLDDFLKLTIDSTSVKANSSWPTDAKILTGLLMRADRLGQKLDIFDMENFRQGWVPRWLKEMDKLEFQICLVAGKANSKGKLKKRYRRLLRCGRKAANSLTEELNRFEQGVLMETLPPSRRMLLQRVLDQIKTDLTDANRVIGYANDRIFHDKNLPSTEKVLSLSDGSAAYIKKGSRSPVIGYKPQLVRSENGFVTSLIVPEGNAADSMKLVPAIRESINRTGVIAELVSTDDGYASAKGRDEVLGMKVKAISISGAKGKKLTDDDDWQSEIYRDARRDRSAVESLMFTIKDGFEFGELGRRGIDAVQSELMEKVLAYNCCRIILMKKRRREALDKAA